jgi:hypothetical protein
VDLMRQATEQRIQGRGVAVQQKQTTRAVMVGQVLF